MANPPHIDLPIVGSSRNVPQDTPEYTLNLYGEKESDSVITLKPTPGTELKYDITGVVGGCRAQITIQNRYFVIVGALFFEVVAGVPVNSFINPPADPAPTPPCPIPSPFYVGSATLNSASGPVQMVANNPPGDRAQILIVDGANGYVFELGASPGEGGWVTASVMAARGFVGGGSQVAFCAGRGIALKPGTAQWQFSKLYDFTNWCDSTDTGFATCLSLLDSELLALLSNGDRCYFFSARGFEVWQNVGSTPNPLKRILAYDKIGVIAPQSVFFSDRYAYWLGGEVNGQGVVYRHSGGSVPERISDHPTERRIAALPNPADARASFMKPLGHSFYILTFEDGGKTFCYDSGTNLWHDRGQRAPQSGKIIALPFVSIIIVDGEYLGIDFRDGKIWRIADEIHNDAGEPIPRVRTMHPIPDEADYLSYYQSAELFCEVGNTPAGEPDPVVEFEYSTDRGETWSYPEEAPLGGNNSYQTRVKFSGLGSGYTISFRFKTIANQFISWRKVRVRAQ